MVKVYNAQNIIEAKRIVRILKENRISAFYRQALPAISTHSTYGFGLDGVDILVDDTDEARARTLLKFYMEE